MAGRSVLEAFTSWLTRFGDAWEAGDPGVLASLFTAGATLQPTPFDELLRGKRAIGEHFERLFADWSAVSFSAQVLGAGDTYGVAHFRVSSSDRALDGVLVVAMDERGRCTSLRQWWHEAAHSAGRWN